jgi:hypothetical protein
MHALFTVLTLRLEKMQPTIPFPGSQELTPEIPPTWADGSKVFHISERCGRLRVIPKSKRITGKPLSSLRQCFNCEDIIRAKRRG